MTWIYQDKHYIKKMFYHFIFIHKIVQLITLNMNVMNLHENTKYVFVKKKIRHKNPIITFATKPMTFNHYTCNFSKLSIIHCGSNRRRNLWPRISWLVQIAFLEVFHTPFLDYNIKYMSVSFFSFNSLSFSACGSDTCRLDLLIILPQVTKL